MQDIGKRIAHIPGKLAPKDNCIIQTTIPVDSSQKHRTHATLGQRRIASKKKDTRQKGHTQSDVSRQMASLSAWEKQTAKKDNKLWQQGASRTMQDNNY